MSFLNKEIKIVIGAGAHNNNPGWIHTQEDQLNLLNEEQWQFLFEENSINMILAEHVWEHLTFEEGKKAAKICHKYLKSGGHIRCAVPDGFFQNEEYQKVVQVGGPGPKDHPAASHKIVYNFRTLSEMFASAGFTIDLLEYCDETGKFHYKQWNPMSGVIYRSKYYDHRNKNGNLACVSLIVDAIKN